jgi:hypothetical protein
MTDSDWPMVGVYLVLMIGTVLLLNALSMRDKSPTSHRNDRGPQTF